MDISHIYLRQKSSFVSKRKYFIEHPDLVSSKWVYVGLVQVFIKLLKLYFVQMFKRQ